MSVASRVAWTAAVAREAERLKMSWAYWEFGAGFGIYDPAARQFREPLLKALIPNDKGGTSSVAPAGQP